MLCGGQKEVCSACCVERGVEGVVWCLECLDKEGREVGLAAARAREGDRTVDWVRRQRELLGL